MTFIPQALPPAGYPLSEWSPPVLGQIEPAPFILADRFVPPAGDALSSAWDIGSLLEGDDPTDAAILYSFFIEQVGVDAHGRAHGGIANGTAGHHLYTIDKALPGASLELQSEARRVLDVFVRRGDIEAPTVTASIEGGNTAIGALEIEYHNTHTGTVQRLGGL